MKKNKALCLLLLLVGLTSGSFTLSKYVHQNTFIVRVADQRYDGPTVSNGSDNDYLDIQAEEVLKGNYFYSTTYQYTVPEGKGGYYFIQLWGATGGPPSYAWAGGVDSMPGNGGYLLGLLNLQAEDKLDINLGQFGWNNSATNVGNQIGAGGGTGGTGGLPEYNGFAGGAPSEVFLNSDRIMIAGGGGGAGNQFGEKGNNGGSGGTMAAYNGSEVTSAPVDNNWKVFVGDSGMSSDDGVFGGNAGQIGTTYNKNVAAIKGGGGGGGYNDGAAGGMNTNSDSGSGGGGGSSAYNESVLTPVVDGSYFTQWLAWKLGDLSQVQPADIAKYHGAVRLVYLPDATLYGESGKQELSYQIIDRWGVGD